VVTDLRGPARLTSYAGYIYYVPFVDACFRYTWIFPIKSKGDTYIFLNFKQLVELELGFKIKNIMMENIDL